ncbi:hypothetical protein IWZ00DRAFT_268957 [Phyllosticta capitalensis]|uniref:Uncharacterized protein n=1 Tax=Phyllosticta capitalensis TaxID=121624 RepID=A0ABR1YP39_9PEZI
MEVDEPTYLKVNGPACTITPMDVLTYTRIMHKHTKAQFLASTTPAPASPTEISSSPPASPTLKPAATKADPIAFDSGSLHIPPPPTTAATSASNASSTDASAGITATTIITTTTSSTAAADDDDAAQAHAAAVPHHPTVYSSIHTGRTSGPMSALHRSLISASAPASAPLPTSHTPSPSSSPAAALPPTAHFDPAAVTARTTPAVPTADAAQHRRRSSAGLRKISAGLAKLGLWRAGGGGHHAVDHQHQHQHQHHSQSDYYQQQQQQQHHWRQAPTAGHEGAEPAGDDEMDIDEVDGQPLAHLQCECGACDWCRLRRGVLKRNGLCNVGVGGPAGAAAGRRDTV